MAKHPFWSALLDGVDPETVRRVRYGVARHFPGLGGEEAVDRLREEEVRDLFSDLRTELEREAAAVRGRGRR